MNWLENILPGDRLPSIESWVAEQTWCQVTSSIGIHSETYSLKSVVIPFRTLLDLGNFSLESCSK